MPFSPATTPLFLQALTDIVGPEHVRVGTAIDVLDPGVDARHLAARVLVRPADALQTGKVLGLCTATQVAAVAQGGRTGLSGGACTTAGDLILSLERMDAIEHVDALGRTVTVQAGVTLARLEEALALQGLSAGIDLGARGSATIGGMVATNAGGIDAFRHGTMRERVLGLEVALASGEVLTQLTRVRKDNAGLPLRQLFIGSEGTLGVLTRVVLAVVPASGVRHTALAVVADLAAAIRVLRAIESCAGATLVAAELMSGNHIALTSAALGVTQLAGTAPAGFGLLLGVTGREDDRARSELEATLSSAAEDGLLVDCVVAKNAAEERDLWRVREDWAVDRARPGGLWYDISVPLDALARYLDRLAQRIEQHDPSLSMYVVGHLGDGNVHVTINAASPIVERYGELAALVYAGLREVGGSFSAEHGIGLEKRSSLEQWAGPTGIGLMRAVKAVFDPAGILNPGKVLRSDTD